MAGSIHDYDRLFAQAYKNLRPGGYLEMQSFEADFFSDDGTRARAKTAIRWQQLLVTASKNFGKNLKVEDEWKGKMERAGFVDVVEEVYKVCFAVYGKWKVFLILPCALVSFLFTFAVNSNPATTTPIGANGPLAQRADAQSSWPVPGSAHVRSARIIFHGPLHTRTGLD